MKKRVVYCLLAAVVIAGTATALSALDLGPETTPLAKLFLAFFGGIIVLQCIPALLLFGCLVKEVLFGASRKSALTEGQSETRVQP